MAADATSRDSLVWAGKIDALCDELEAAWRAGQRPSLEPLLQRLEPAKRGDALTELLRVELELRRAKGDAPVRDEYLARFADLEQAIDQAFDGDRGEAATAPPESAPAGGLKIRCPHCHNPVELLPDAPLDQVECPSCGSRFSLTGGDTGTSDANTITRLGHFELVERLGMGAFGAVWKARDAQLGRIVAVKIPRRGALDAVEKEKFLREARSMAQLRHPNIVPVHEVGRENELLYIVSDFIRGAPLSVKIADSRLSIREAAEMLAKIARALHHAHERGIIHRDLKPQNIMLDESDEPYVTDFGLAKREAGEITMTLDGDVLGTPAYMSPEQARGESHQVDRTSDVFSMGVILFQLLTGELPFRGTAHLLIQKVIHEDPPSPRRLDHRIPRDLETICLKCLEKDPRQRYSTADLVGEDLERYLSGRPIHSRPRSRIHRGLRWAYKNRAITVLAATVALSLLVGSVSSTWLAIRFRNSERVATQSAAGKQKVLDALVASLGSVNTDNPEVTYQNTLLDVLASLRRSAELEMQEDPRASATMLNAIGQTCRSLRQFDNAIACHEGAYALLSRELGELHNDTLDVLHELGTSYLWPGKFRDALAAFEKAAAGFMKLHGRSDKRTVASLLDISACHAFLDDRVKAILTAEEALAGARASADESLLANVLHQLGVLYSQVNRLPDALNVQKEAWELSRRQFGDDDARTATVSLGVAVTYVGLGDVDAALPIMHSVLEFRKRKFGPQDANVLVCLGVLESAYQMAGRHEEAEPIIREWIEGAKVAPHFDPSQLPLAQIDLAEVLVRQGELQEASSMAGEGVKNPQIKPIDAARARNIQGLALAAEGQQVEAERMLLESCQFLVAEFPKIQPSARWRVFSACERLIDFYTRANRAEDAKTWRRQIQRLEKEMPQLRQGAAP